MNKEKSGVVSIAAFGRKATPRHVIVDAEGRVLVYDHVAEHFTRHAGLTARQMTHVRNAVGWKKG